MDKTEMTELIETPVWELYQKCQRFMELRGIYSDTDLNNRMYNGDQLYGLKVQGIEKIQFNFIKPVVDHKTSKVTSNLFAINFSPDNIDNVEFMETAQKACELLNKKASKVFDKDMMDKKIKKWVKRSAINDESVCYVNYNEDNDIFENEIISKNDIMYGDENNDDIQTQPYILIRQRKSVIDVQQYAERMGVSKSDLVNITGDKDTSTVAGISGKDEMDDKCWLITKFYRKNGVVHFSKATQYCTIKEDADTGVELYPIAHLTWEDEEGNARGVGVVRQLIPNQMETNKTAMRRALVVKNTAYPQKVINLDAIQNPNDANKVGATIYFKDMGNTRASDVFMTTTPGQMGADSEKLQSELINYSKDLNNAGDATTGNINPESASGKAILAVQNAQNQPLTDQLIKIKSFIEDIARIWFEYWKVHSEGLTIEVEEKDSISGESTFSIQKIPSYVLEALSTSVKVDITPKGAFDKYAQELSWENLFTTGKITFDEYVDGLDPDSVMPKTKLEAIQNQRHEAQKQINQMQMQANQMKMQAMEAQAKAQDIQGMATMGDSLINQYVDNQATM